MVPHANGDVEVTGLLDTTGVVIPDPVLVKDPTYARFTLDDVLPHRQQSTTQMPRGVAAFANADMFKSKGNAFKPKAKDFTYRITPESASRKPSSLKGVMQYFRPDMISLCGGLPSPEYFPFETVSARVPRPPAFSERDASTASVDATTGKYDVRQGKGLYDLHIAMNYGQSMGPAPLIRFLTEHMEIVHSPKYGDWDVIITTGNTAALDHALRMFCQRGDFILTEEYSFSSATEAMLPQGLIPVGVAIDDFGMRADALDYILSNWDENERGGPKPFLTYIIPTGQNPSGATQTLERRKAVYAVAEKHDLIILEDDPYYFLQMEPYVSGVTHEVSSPFQPMPTSDFVSALVPSYLSLDTSGRVVRMDSFSKVLAPGTRIGWVTASPQIVERFLRNQELSTQNTSGFASSIIYQLLEDTWGHKGYLEWLMFIRMEYTRRRDIMVNACEKYLPADVARWKAPMAGMFHWIEIDASKHPDVKSGAVQAADLEERIFLTGIKTNVLVARGSWFFAEKDSVVRVGPGAVRNRGDEKTGDGPASPDLFFRMTFAAASQDQIVEAVKRFGDALRLEFGRQ